MDMQADSRLIQVFASHTCLIVGFVMGWLIYCEVIVALDKRGMQSRDFVTVNILKFQTFYSIPFFFCLSFAFYVVPS